MKSSVNIVPLAIGISAFVGITAIIGTSVIAGGQPDGLNPPPGPITDTQPSLTSIDQKIDSIASTAFGFPQDLQYAYDSVGGNQTNETVEFVSATEADFVRLYGVTVHASGTNLLVGPSQDCVASIAGSAVSTNGQVQGSSYVDLGGLRVPTPVNFQTGGQNSSSTITLLYWIDE